MMCLHIKSSESGGFRGGSLPKLARKWGDRGSMS